MYVYFGDFESLWHCFIFDNPVDETKPQELMYDLRVYMKTTV